MPKCRNRHFVDNAPHERVFSTFHRPSDSNPSSALRPPPPCPIRHSSILPTATQPFPQPSNNHSNHNQTTTQPSFVSNPRTIPTQPSSIRDPTTPTQPCINKKRRGKSVAPPVLLWLWLSRIWRITNVGWLCRNRSWIRHEGWLCCGWSVVAGRFEKLLGGGWVNGFLSR